MYFWFSVFDLVPAWIGRLVWGFRMLHFLGFSGTELLVWLYFRVCCVGVSWALVFAGVWYNMDLRFVA